ncbi:MAG: hypothetical protein JW797_02995 [Bradymonadales bacterium]|nr:hypothetical protein [Bradymonadales bacterium]
MGKKEKKYGPKAALDADQLEQLRANLDDERFEATEEPVVSALANYLAERQDVEGLVTLHDKTPNRKLKKEVNKALYRLKQQGLSVPDLKEQPEAVQIAAGPIEVDDLPVLMARPEAEGLRTFLFAHAEGRDLLGVELQILVPLGIARLTSFRSNRTHFRKYIMGLSQQKSPRMRRPHRYAVVCEALRRRKLWEIDTLVQDKRIGPQIDRRLLDSLPRPDKPPLHPAWNLDLSAARPLPFEQLAALQYPMDPFFHPPAYARLKTQLEDWKSEGIIQGPGEEGSVDQKLFEAIGDWANQWVFDRIAELLLDSVLFYHAAGLVDVALTLRDVVNAPRVDPRDRQIHAFLNQYIRWSFSLPADGQ